MTADSLADSKKRSEPGDLSKGEICIVKPGVFDEDGPHVQLLEDEVELPSGRKDRLVRVTRSPKAADGVVVVPITHSDEIVLVHQFRHAPRIWTWELPRGATEVGDAPEDTLHAELLQEIGCEAVGERYSLGRIVPDSGTLHEIPYIWAVRVRPHPTEGPSPEPNELIVGHKAIGYDMLWELCVSGELNDAFTLAAVLRLRRHYRNGRFDMV